MQEAVRTLLPEGRLAELQLRAYDCGGDGACMYKSFAHQLARLNIRLTWIQVKARALQWLKARNAAALHDLRPALVLSLPATAAILPLAPSPAEWSATVDVAYGAEQSWGDELMLRSLASEFQVNVRLMGPGHDRDIHGAQQQTPAALFTLVHIAETHYQSTAPLPNATQP